MYKNCPNCKEKNLETARFCVGCEKEFGKKLVKAKASKVVAPPPPPIEVDLEAIQDDIETGIEIDPASRVEARRIAAGFQIQVEDRDRPKGFSLEEVISNQVKPAPRERRITNDKRNGLKILREDGGNSKR